MIVYPFYVIEQALNNPLVADLVVHKGEGWYVLDGKRYVVPENHFFILPAEKPHQYGSSEHDPWYIYWAHFKGKKAKYISDQLQGVIPIDMDDNSRIGDRIAFFDELLNVLESGTDEATVNYVNLSFNHLIASFLYVKTYREAKFSKSKAENTFFISLATHFMTENLENKLTLKELASHFGYSESYMYRLFFKETGYAPMNYFLHMKIDRACQLLLHTNMKINQVALKLGFDDPYYFIRHRSCRRLYRISPPGPFLGNSWRGQNTGIIFKKIVGTSPKDYRHSLPK